MYKRCFMGLFALLLMVGCSSKGGNESEAERRFVAAHDLEEELDMLPQAIARYGEIAAEFPNTPAGEKARKRQEMLKKAQAMLTHRSAVAEDSLEAFYERVLPVAPDYLALLKRLGTIYYNKTRLLVPSAVNLGLIEMKEEAVATWEKQDRMWSAYTFRPIPADRLWQDRLCKQAIEVTQMLVHERFRNYDQGLAVINRGLAHASGEDVIARAKVYAAYCTFWKGGKEDFETGIELANAALGYEFLADADRARAYHVVGLCYAYLYQDTEALADLDAAIKALNECVNIDSGMGEARELLKGLRQQRDRVAQAL